MYVCRPPTTSRIAFSSFFCRPGQVRLARPRQASDCRRPSKLGHDCCEPSTATNMTPPFASKQQQQQLPLRHRRCCRRQHHRLRPLLPLPRLPPLLLLPAPPLWPAQLLVLLLLLLLPPPLMTRPLVNVCVLVRACVGWFGVCCTASSQPHHVDRPQRHVGHRSVTHCCGGCCSNRDADELGRGWRRLVLYAGVYWTLGPPQSDRCACLSWFWWLGRLNALVPRHP
jgi:hypothetical protein